MVPSEVCTFLVADGRAVLDGPCAGAVFLDLNKKDMVVSRQRSVYVDDNPARRLRSCGREYLISFLLLVRWLVRRFVGSFVKAGLCRRDPTVEGRLQWW